MYLTIVFFNAPQGEGMRQNNMKNNDGMQILKKYDIIIMLICAVLNLCHPYTEIYENFIILLSLL